MEEIKNMEKAADMVSAPALKKSAGKSERKNDNSKEAQVEQQPAQHRDDTGTSGEPFLSSDETCGRLCGQAAGDSPGAVPIHHCRL